MKRACLFLFMSFFLHGASGTGDNAPDWQGLDDFFGMLRARGMSLSSSLESPLIMVLGTPPRSPGTGAFLNAVQKGALLVVATESAASRDFLARLGFSLGSAVTLKPPMTCFRNQADCPIIRDLNRSDGARLFQDTPNLVLNRAKTMAVLEDGLTLARFPTLMGQGAPFACSRRLGQGDIMALGDQSIFINLMLPEGGNRAFVQNLLSLRPRTRSLCLYVNGMLIQSPDQAIIPQNKPVDMPDLLDILPDISPSVQDLNRLMADIQKDLPAKALGKTLKPVFILLIIIVLLVAFIRTILGLYFPAGNPFTKLFVKKGSDLSFTASHLTGLAPARERPRLLRLARKARKPRTFSRFLSALEKAIEAETHDTGNP